MNNQLRLYQTDRFSVLGLNNEENPLTSTRCAIPLIRLVDLLLCRHQKSSRTKENQVRQTLWDALESFGFIVLACSQTSEPGKIVHELKQCVDEDFFPIHDESTVTALPSSARKRPRNVAQLQSGLIYLNEKNVPMYKLGYELCDDIREVYRVAAGSPDSQKWPSISARSTWIRGMALCRHICDEALQLTLGYNMEKRPGSGPFTWKTLKTTTNRIPYYQQGSLEDRSGDKSVMYAMHYFNDYESILARASGRVTGTDDLRINVKEHTDPSLFVLEPFLADVEGLEVYPRPLPIHFDQGSNSTWIACDGNSSPIRKVVKEEEGDMAMILFVGRAFALKAFELTGRKVEPTLHRVVGPTAPSNKNRRTVIYEQKYEEYFPPPTMD